MPGWLSHEGMRLALGVKSLSPTLGTEVTLIHFLKKVKSLKEKKAKELNVMPFTVEMDSPSLASSPAHSLVLLSLYSL